MATYGQDVWVANPSSHELERIGSPYTGIAERIPLPAPKSTGTEGYAGVAAGAGAVWVAGNDAQRRVWRVDPSTRRVTPIDLPFAPRAIAAGLGGVWVVDRKGGAVVRLDPATGRITKRIPVGLGPVAVSLGADSVWVANQLSGTVSRIDPKRFTVHDTSVGTDPVDLAVGLGAVWVVRRTT